MPYSKVSGKNAKLQVRSASAASWSSANPVLSASEPGVEDDTGKIKVGNGVDAWADLPYSGGTAGVGVPVGGSTGEVLAKASGTDYDTEWVAASGGGAALARGTDTWTVSSLAAASGSSVDWTVEATAVLLSVNFTEADVRLRIYSSSAARTADVARAVGTDPTGDHGLLFEFVSATGLTSAVASPAPVIGMGTGSDWFVRVDNVGVSTVSVDVTLSWLGLEV